jgi:hypothetical protein
MRLGRCFINAFYGCEFFENLTGAELQGVANNNAFYNCRFNNNDAEGILISGAAIGTLLSGCEIEANGTHGLSITGAALDTTLDTCYIEGNTTNNVILDSASINTNIRNCFFWQPASASNSVYFKQGSRLSISGNFYSADANETTYAIKTDSTASDLSLGQIYYSGFTSGAYGLDRNSSTTLVSAGNGGVTASNNVRAGTGVSSTTPKFLFLDDEDTGVGRSGTNELALIVGGSRRQWLNSTHGATVNNSNANSAFTIQATAALQGGLGSVQRVLKNAYTTAVGSGGNRNIKALATKEVGFIKVFYSWPSGAPSYKFGAYTFDGTTVSTSWFHQSNGGHVFTLSNSSGNLNIAQSVGVTMSMVIEIEYANTSALD